MARNLKQGHVIKLFCVEQREHFHQQRIGTGGIRDHFRVDHSKVCYITLKMYILKIHTSLERGYLHATGHIHVV